MSLVGLFVLIYGAGLVTPNSIYFFGIPILLIGAFLIMAGLIPIRRLNRLEIHPHELIVTKNQMYYIVEGIQKVSIPLNTIKDIRYIEENRRYGIAVNEFFFPFFPRRQFSRLGLLRLKISRDLSDPGLNDIVKLN